MLGGCVQGFINKGYNSQFTSMFSEIWNCAICTLNNYLVVVETNADTVWLKMADLICSHWGHLSTSVKKS